MLILLPPSEGKATGRRGRPLDLATLSFPELTASRRAVLAALAAVSARPDALERLGAPASAAATVAAQADIERQPTLPVGELYTGVLYDALDLASLGSAARRRASRDLVVVSAAFGAVRPRDRVPSYRLSMDVDLEPLGRLARFWSPALEPVLTPAAGRDVIVDLRSSTYAAAWRPRGALAERTVAVHVVRLDPTGGPGAATAVSHMAKHTRGLVARALLDNGIAARTPEALADALGHDFCVHLGGAQPGRPRRLDVVEPG